MRFAGRLARTLAVGTTSGCRIFSGFAIDEPPRHALGHQAAFQRLGRRPDAGRFAINKHAYFLQIWLEFPCGSTGNLDTNATEVFGLTAIGTLPANACLATGIMTNMRHNPNSNSGSFQTR